MRWHLLCMRLLAFVHASAGSRGSHRPLVRGIFTPLLAWCWWYQGLQMQFDCMRQQPPQRLNTLPPRLPALPADDPHAAQAAAPPDHAIHPQPHQGEQQQRGGRPAGCQGGRQWCILCKAVRCVQACTRLPPSPRPPPFRHLLLLWPCTPSSCAAGPGVQAADAEPLLGAVLQGQLRLPQLSFVALLRRCSGGQRAAAPASCQSMAWQLRQLVSRCRLAIRCTPVPAPPVAAALSWLPPFPALCLTVSYCCSLLLLALRSLLRALRCLRQLRPLSSTAVYLKPLLVVNWSACCMDAQQDSMCTQQRAPRVRPHGIRHGSMANGGVAGQAGCVE